MPTEIISGLNPIHEVLRAAKRRVKKIWIAHKKKDETIREIEKLAEIYGIKLIPSTREELFKLSRIEKHQGIVAEVDTFKYSPLNDILERGRKDPKGHFILILDSILDPQNLGSMIRTAYLTGIHGVIIPERNSAQIGPAATRAAAGAVEYIPIARVTNLARTMINLKKEGVWFAAAEMGDGENLYSHVFSGSYALVVGSEGRGLRRLVKEECDFLLNIPMSSAGGGVGSYNVSVAAAIFMSEMSRQRNYKKGT